MNSDEELQSLIEQASQNSTTSFRFFDPDEYALEEIFDEILEQITSAQREEFLGVDREMTLFAVFNMIGDYERSARRPSESLADLIFSQYLLKSNQRAADEP